MPTPGRERVAAVALAVLAPVIFWGCLETTARLAGVTPLTEDEAYVAFTSQRHCQFGWRAAETACQPKHFEHDKRRLLVTLGGSSVHGYPFGQPSFAPKLGNLLKRAELHHDRRLHSKSSALRKRGLAPKNWRVVNRGFACKNSHFLEACAQHALDAGAELLVIYAGHNDFATYGAWNPSRQIWLEKNAWIYDLEVWLAGTRSFSALIGMLRSDAAPQWFPTQPDPERIAAAQEVVLEAFTDHVTSVIDRAAETGARVILSTVVSNLYEFPVKREDWDSSPLYDPEGRPDLVHWAKHYRAGIASHRAGDFDAALASFSTARDLFMRGRAPSILNARVRELTADYDHVELVDFERLLQAHASKGIGCNFFGDDSYCDQFHPNDRTHTMIAGALLRKMREMQFVAAPGRRAR